MTLDRFENQFVLYLVFAIQKFRRNFEAEALECFPRIKTCCLGFDCLQAMFAWNNHVYFRLDRYLIAKTPSQLDRSSKKVSSQPNFSILFIRRHHFYVKEEICLHLEDIMSFTSHLCLAHSIIVYKLCVLETRTLYMSVLYVSVVYVSVGHVSQLRIPKLTLTSSKISPALLCTSAITAMMCRNLRSRNVFSTWKCQSPVGRG